MNVLRHVPVGGFQVGNDLPLTIIAGPCAMESVDHALDMAGALKEATARLGLKFIYKTSFDKANRTSVKSNRGIGLEQALPIFARVRAQLGVPVLTDVHLPDQCAVVAEVVDVLQIPAFLSRQTDLLLAAAATGRPVNVKKGQFLAPWDMKNVVEKFDHAGHPNVMLCERGVSFGYNTLVSDMRALPIMAETGCPVVFDATHSVQQPGGQGASSGGLREFIPHGVRAAVAVGVDARFLEVHPDPAHALSDAATMLPLSELKPLLAQAVAIDAVITRG